MRNKECTKNNIKKILIDLGISNSDSIVPYYPRTRDREDIFVLKCMKSGVLLLSRTDHMTLSYYEDKKEKNSLAIDKIDKIEDTERRYNQHKNSIANKKWLDIGTGSGAILEVLSKYALETHAVEPQKSVREKLSKLGYTMYRTTEEAPNNYFDVITLFHVFEHFTEPINELKIIKEKMKKNSKIIIEIPHAKDFLISFLDNEPFKAFTFWSEHLILHTRESIFIILKKVGFENIIIKGFQRYSLANHLYWLSKGMPNGHKIWNELRNNNLDEEYQKMLSSIDKNDTLLVMAQK